MNERKILAVDDDPVILDFLEKKLCSYNYTVIKASGGQEAVEKAKSYLPQLILLDIILPDMDGAEVIQSLKENPQTENIPILLLSGIASKDEERDEHFSVNVGGRRFKTLAKPFDFVKLLSEIRKFLG